MAGRLLFATAVAFAVGCVAVGLYDVIVGLHEYNDKQDPPKNPYEHCNNSDETLVDPNNESAKRHEVRDSEDQLSINCAPLAPDSNPNDHLQTPTPPPTPPDNGHWPVMGLKPPKGRVIVFEDSAPLDEETSTPLSVLPPDVLGASFKEFEVQETIEQVLERMQSS